jgi:16S rRNA (guanine966-N2)-methyltransferase
MSNPRIITGSAKGQKLEVPLKGTKPMTDRVKSALFSMINPLIFKSQVLDLYAGTGALGIECLSRGAKQVVFVDKSRKAVECIQNNLEKTGFSSLAEVIKASALRFLDEYGTFNLGLKKYDVIFITPPHKKYSEEVISKASEFLKKDGVIVAEHSSKTTSEDRVGLSRRNGMKTEDLAKIDERKYGKTSLSFYKRTKAEISC